MGSEARTGKKRKEVLRLKKNLGEQSRNPEVLHCFGGSGMTQATRQAEGQGKGAWFKVPRGGTKKKRNQLSTGGGLQ